MLKGYGGATPEQIANDLGLDPNESILNPGPPAQTESIATYIAKAKNKAARAAPGGADDL